LNPGKTASLRFLQHFYNTFYNMERVYQGMLKINREGKNPAKCLLIRERG